MQNSWPFKGVVSVSQLFGGVYGSWALGPASEDNTQHWGAHRVAARQAISRDQVP